MNIQAVTLLAGEVGSRLFERLEFIRLKPEAILDLSSASDFSTPALEKQFPEATITKIDRIENLPLPYSNHSFDLVFSNLLLPWCADIGRVLLEIKRILKPNGVFLFSTLGPDTLYELRKSWWFVDTHQHVQDFLDMHHLGDLLTKQQWSDPVVDMEKIVIHYDAVSEILKDIKNSGLFTSPAKRPQTLTGKTKFQSMIAEYEKYRDENKKLPVTLEIVYGLAYATENIKKNTDEFFVSVKSILRSSSRRPFR